MTAGRNAERAQATVELAVVLPVIFILLLTVVQAGMLVTDNMSVVNATRVAARAAAVRPDEAHVRRSLAKHGIRAEAGSIHLSGDLSPGGIATVETNRSPTVLPVLGRFLGGITLRGRLTFRVEDPIPED